MKFIPAFIAILALALAPFARAESPAKSGFAFYGGASVASVSVGTAGTGYTSLPTVAFSGGSGGVQATGTSTLKIVSKTVTAGGTGYTVGDVLTIVGGTKSTASTMTVSTVSGGVVTGVNITNAGVYTVPVLTAAATTGGTGTGCTITPVYGVGTVVVVTGGAGYLTAPTIDFTGGAGSSAAATATLDSGATTALAIPFSEIVPQTDSVISAITFPTGVAVRDDDNSVAVQSPYTGDASVIGKTLTAGRLYRIYGTSVTFSSGTGYLIRR